MNAFLKQKEKTPTHLIDIYMYIHVYIFILYSYKCYKRVGLPCSLVPIVFMIYVQSFSDKY